MSFPNLTAAIEGYLITKSAKGLSQNTLRNYRGDLERFAQQLHDPPIDTVTSRQIERYFNYLNEEFTFTRYGPRHTSAPKKLSAQSVQNAWSALCWGLCSPIPACSRK